MPIPFLPIALAAGAALSAYSKNRQYRPVLEANDRTGAILDIAGAGLGGFLGGASLQQGGIQGALGGLFGVDNGGTSGVDTSQLPQRQQGNPGFIPANQFPQAQTNILPGETAGVPNGLEGLLGGGGQGGGLDLETLALLSQLASQQQSGQGQGQGQGGGGLLDILG